MTIAQVFDQAADLDDVEVGLAKIIEKDGEWEGGYETNSCGGASLTDKREAPIMVGRTMAVAGLGSATVWFAVKVDGNDIEINQTCEDRRSEIGDLDPDADLIGQCENFLFGGKDVDAADLLRDAFARAMLNLDSSDLEEAMKAAIHAAVDIDRLRIADLMELADQDDIIKNLCS